MEGRGVRDEGSHAGLTVPVKGDGRGVEGTKGRAEGGISGSVPNVIALPLSILLIDSTFLLSLFLNMSSQKCYACAVRTSM